MQDPQLPNEPEQPELSDQPGTCGLVRKSLLRQLFAGAYMMRWNDKLRPCPLAEIDKQAHKMIVTAVLWTRTCASRPRASHYPLAQELIEGALFDYFFRLVVTDIKPPIFYRIQANKSHYDKLVHYVFGRLEAVLAPLGPFWDRFRTWHTQKDSFEEARTILSAAHQFASQWEFQLIRPLNGFDRELPQIAATFEENLRSLATRVPGMDDILADTALSRFVNFCGQLRFQIRWTQLARIPQTDVLGHMFFVGALAYLYSLTLGTCQARRVNNFFCGLFHDLPELLTRDIISPIKQSSSELARLIRDYEEEELDRRILSPLKEAGEDLLVSRLRYYLGLEVGSEFAQRFVLDGTVHTTAGFAELHAAHDRDSEHPLDGQLVKACDLLAAFLEADESLRNGVASGYLTQARLRLAGSLQDRTRFPSCLQLDSLLADFD